MINVIMEGEPITVSSLWNTMAEWQGVGADGMDVGAYVTGGMVVWPCGDTFQAGGKDGFKEDVGNPWCECDTCQKVRQILKGYPPDFQINNIIVE